MFFRIASADVEVSFIDETKLPYEHSPRNYNNSPRNYDNSIRNYDNSSSNYDNSPKNYDNSSANYDNSRNGNHRIIYDRKFFGYYTISSSGVINFYSPSGKRMFYNPKKSNAIFDAEQGEFSGVLGNVGGTMNLVLTKYGVKVLYLNQ